ncbi:MAG: aspartate carbamoyltransferase, partial [Alistipes sp.]|nr:aspartate carbamoyltransferase [Alistipes sp.]
FDHTPVFSENYIQDGHVCHNKCCISSTEDVDQIFRYSEDGTLRCAYCEAKAK